MRVKHLDRRSRSTLLQRVPATAALGQEHVNVPGASKILMALATGCALHLPQFSSATTRTDTLLATAHVEGGCSIVADAAERRASAIRPLRERSCVTCPCDTPHALTLVALVDGPRRTERVLATVWF